MEISSTSVYITVDPACKSSFVYADEADGSVQWKMTQYPRLYVKTADTYNNSYLLEVKVDLRRRGMSW